MHYKTGKAAPATWIIDLVFLTLILGVVFFLFLGSRPLLVPEEGRYAEIIREMFVSHDYVTPYVDGVKYFEKPVLFYWFGVFAAKIAGLNLWSLRSINALFGLAGCLLTYAFARKFYDRTTGLFAGLILGASGLYFLLLHVINLDTSATFFLSVSLFGFLFGIQQPLGCRRRFVLWIAFAAAALAVMTKGLIGIVFPVLIVGLWIVLLNEWRLLKTLYLPSCILIFLLIAVPWHWIVSLRHPEFFHFYFIEQQFVRFATTEIGHYQPVWFFVPIILAGFFPWIVFLPAAIAQSWCFIREKKTTYQLDFFLLIWIVAIFVFFSFSNSKLVSYILPMFPPLAILVGRYLSPLKNNRVQLAVLWIATIIFLQLMIPIILANNTQSTASLIPVIQQKLSPQDEVITYKQYYSDLPFYLSRQVGIVNWRGELAFGSQFQKTPWLMDEKTFWQKWQSHRRVFVFTDDNEFATLLTKKNIKKICILGRSENIVLFTQCK